MDLLEESVGADDDRADLPEEEVADIEEAQVEEVTRRTAGGSEPEAREKAILEEMMIAADAAGMQPDGRVRHLTGWIRDNLLDGRGGARSGSSFLPNTRIRSAICAPA